jgi:hypothetical protein
LSRTQFFPYPVVESALRLTYELQADQLEGIDQWIRAVDLPEPGAVTVALRVEVEEGTYEKVLPEAELHKPPVHMVVALRSVTARERQTVPMVPENGHWGGVLDMPKSELYGQVDLEPMLVRSAQGDAGTGYAAHRGAVIATGEAVKVVVDEPPLRAGGFLEVRFENFSDSASPRRHGKPQLLYLLDTDGETPVLWLNEGIPEFKTVMLARGPRGYNLRVRDAMFDTIVSQVWTSLASVALTNLAMVIQETEDDDEADPVGSLPDWQQRVIGFWAPRLYTGGRDEAVDTLVETASDRRLVPELFDRLGVAVQEWARTGQAFRGLIRLRDREGV